MAIHNIFNFQWEYTTVSQAVTNLHAITWCSNRDAKYTFNDKHGWRDAILFG